MSVGDPESPRDLGEFFRFIAEVTDVFPDNSFEDISDRLNLVATTGKFGITFISNQSCIKVFNTKQLVDKKETTPLKTISAKGSITHIATSCDGQTLFVVALVDGSFGFFYDVYHLLKNDKDPVPFYTVPLSTEVVSRVTSLSWNPCDASCIAVALSTGDLCLLRIKNSSIEFLNKDGLGANAVTWSAKGKQLAVGKKDGTLALFKPDLTLVRSIEAPVAQGIGPVIDITWFTNTEFFVGYVATDNIPALFYVNAPKGKPAKFFGFEDVCYSSESGRPVSYYTVFISDWSVLFVFSSNGIEMGLIGKTESENSECRWCHWSPDEGVRASMHFYNIKYETFPLGLAVDFTSQKTFSSKDEKKSGPFPVLVTLSTKGELNVFFVENKMIGAQNLSVASESLPSTGHRTPEQFGQLPAIGSQTTGAPPTPVEFKSNSLSAFSFIPKKSEGEAANPTPFSISTPVKSFSSDSQPSTAAPVPFTPAASPSVFSSTPASKTFQNLPSSFSFTSVSTPSSRPTLSSSLVPKPVSLSNKIGATVLHAPSPKKSIAPQGISLSATAPVQTPPATSKPAVPTQPASSGVSKEKEMALIEKDFAREISELCKVNNSIDHQVGSVDEDAEIKSSLEEVKQWMADMVKTTEEQSDEVGHLHHKTLEAFAVYEDANAYREIKVSSRSRTPVQLRPLDPYSQRKLDEVRSKYQYLVSQISEVNAKLDLMWEDFASHKQLPKVSQRSISENLYRSVLNLHNMRIVAEEELSGILHQLKKLTIHPILPSSISLTSSFDFSSNYFRTLGRPDLIPQSPQPKLSLKKSRLREVLSQRSYTPIRTHLSTLGPRHDSGTLYDAKDTTSLQVEDSRAGLYSKSLDASNFVSSFPSSVAKAEYEDTPQKSPVKAPSSSALAALCSLVDKVPGTEAPSTRNLPTTSGIKTEPCDVNGLPVTFSFSLNQSLKDTALAEASDATFKTSTPNISAAFAMPQVPFGSKSTALQTLPTTSFSLATASNLFASHDVAGFGSASISPPPSTKGMASISVLAPTTAQETSSPLLGMLSTSKPAESLSPNAGLPSFIGTTSTPSTSSFSTLFSPFSGVKTSVSQATLSVSSTSSLPSFTEDKQLSVSTGVASEGLSSQATTTAVSTIKREGGSVVHTQFFTPNISNAHSSSEAGNVLASNPILSAQILKETSATSASGSLASSSSQPFGLFGQLVATPGTYSVSSLASSPSLNFNFGQSTLSSSTLSSTSKTSSLFTLPSTSFSISSQSATSTSLLDQPPVSSLPTISSVSRTSTSSGQSVTSTSIFGHPITSTSIFGQSGLNTPIFGQVTTSASIFGQPTVTTSLTGRPTSSSFLFGQLSAATSTSTQVPPSTSVITNSSSGTSSTTEPTTSTLPFRLLTTNSSSFSQTTENQAVTSALSLTQTTSLFASASVAVPVPSLATQTNTCDQKTTTTSLFDSTVSTSSFSTALSSLSPSSTSAFGQVTSSSLFGKPSETTTVFGQSNSAVQTTTTSPSAPLFGQDSSVVQTTTSSMAPLFGQGDKTPSIFSQLPSNSSMFGTASSSASPFGPLSTTSQSMFGGVPSATGQVAFAKTTSETQQTSFSLPTSGTSLFGSPPPNHSLFGTPEGGSAFQASTSGSAFGQPLSATSTAETSSVVPSGSSSCSIGSSSAFGSSSGSSVFGFGQTKSSSNGTVFGNVGSQPSSGGSIFGGASTTTTQSSIFGGTSSNSSSLGFGAASLFSGGSMFSGLGKASSVVDDSSKNVFGTVKAGPSLQTKLFEGGSSGNIFGGSTPQKSGGAFSPVKTEGPTFGSSPTFGGSPTFGDKSKSAFGGGAIFGGSPSFGAAPTFVGPTIFGGNTSAFSSSDSSGFGRYASSSNATFGSMANQPGSSGFDQLSQQSGGAGVGTTLGGSSFTSWRAN